MSWKLPECPIKKLPKESRAAYNALWIFLELGPVRSVRIAVNKIREMQKENRAQQEEITADGRSGCHERYAKEFNWHERADQYDEWIRMVGVLTKQNNHSETFRSLVEPFQETYQLKVQIQNRLLTQQLLHSIPPGQRPEEPFLSPNDLKDLSYSFRMLAAAGKSIVDDALRFHGLDAIAQQILKDKIVSKSLENTSYQ